MPRVRSGTTTGSQRALLQGERAKLVAQTAEPTELQERLDWFIDATEERAESAGATAA